MAPTPTGTPDLELAPDGSPSDLDLVQRVCAGDLACFEQLMRRHNQRVYRTIRAVLGDDDDVEDAMQQTYVSAFQHLPRFEGRASVATWLTRIALNESFARLRRRQRAQSLTVDDDDRIDRAPSPTPSPEDVAVREEARAFLEQAVDALPPGLRVVFVLRTVEGLDTAETAACLGLSEEVVRTRLHRARAALREWLAGQVDSAVEDAFRFFRPRCDAVVGRVLRTIVQ
jgi:RNA polymerase sigma-70 factor (ECF subfamily)